MSAATHALGAPKSHADAERAFLRVVGDPHALNKYLAIALIAAVAADVGLIALSYRAVNQQHERIVVRIDDIGRAQAVGFTATHYQIQPAEAKYFLAQFAHDYFGRIRATAREDFAHSMLLLAAPLAQARMAVERRDKTLEKWMVSGDDEIAIEIKNIVLTDLSKTPYSAQIDLLKIYRDRGGNEARRERAVVSVTYALADKVDNAAVLVNPLGLVVTALHEDQAF